MRIKRRYFYKYRSLECGSRDYTMRILRDGKIYFPKFAELNDPQDGKIFLNKNLKKGEIIRLHEKFIQLYGYANFEINDLLDSNGDIIKENIELLQSKFEHTRDIFGNYGVMCLSETSTNPVLWAHYSKNSGICIEFDGYNSDLQNPLLNHKVKYSKKYPIIKISDFAKGETAVKKIFYRKYYDWKYEREWRLLNKEGSKEWEIPGKISSIIIGLNIRDNDREEISVIAKSKSISVKKVVLSKKIYEYEIEDC